MKFFTAALSLFMVFSLHAQRNIFDGFDNNDNGWPESITTENMVYVKDGRYTVQSANEGYFRHSFNVKGGFEKHFRIELSVERDTLVKSEKGVGIVWGRANNDFTYMAFLVYGDGSFVFEKKVNGKLETISPAASTYAYSADDMNGFRVERNMETNVYEFSINEQIVMTAPYVQPASDEVGIHLDMQGSYFVDNFWFVEQGDQPTSYQPAALVISPRCGEENLVYTSDFGYSFCVPFGWRVDEYRETHNTVWPLGFPYVVNTDYTKLAIEDSFSVAARNDFKIYCDSLKVTEVYGNTFSKVDGAAGVEVFAGTYRYVADGNATTTYRYYIYHRASGGFMLVETIIPIWEEEYSLAFDRVAYTIATTIQWK